MNTKMTTTVGVGILRVLAHGAKQPCGGKPCSRASVSRRPAVTAAAKKHDGNNCLFNGSGDAAKTRRLMRTIVRASNGDDEEPKAGKPDDDDEEESEGDRRVQDEIAAELKYQTKLYQAQQFLEEKKEEFIEKGEEGKEAMEAEAKVARDRAGLELGLRASEIDEQLAEMLDETAAARARNEKVQAELAELEEQLIGKASGRFRKAPPKNPISALKQEAIDKEAADVDARMRNTLEETQRKSAFTLIILLLAITDISMAAEGAWDKFIAISAAMALVGYQAKNEYNNSK